VKSIGAFEDDDTDVVWMGDNDKSAKSLKSKG
jgi:hypothetical protein